MKIEDHEALDLLAACRQAEPEVVELALAVALAVRVEQPLLRSARLRLCPRLDAGAETGLWFSSLVSSSSASAFVIDHEILAHLREELRQRPQSWLRMARNIVADAHAQEADSLRLEEEIIWLSVRDGAFAAPEIDRRLRSAVKAMVNGPDQGLEVARWANRALLSLPETALQTESAALLAVGTASRLKTNSRNTDWGSLSDLPQGAAWLLPRGVSVAPTEIGVRLRLGELEVTPPGAVLSQMLRLDGGESDTLEVRWEVGGVSGQRAVTPRLDQRIPLPEDCRAVEIRTSSGTVAHLKVLDGVTRGLRLSEDAERNFQLMSSDLQATAESAIQNISRSSGFSGVEYSGGYLYRDPLHRCNIRYSVATSPDSATGIQILEIQDIEPALDWPKESPEIHWPMANHTEVRVAFQQLLTRAVPWRVLLMLGHSESGKSHIIRQMLTNALRVPDSVCGCFDFKGTSDGDEELLRAFVQQLDAPMPPAAPHLNERLSNVLDVLKQSARPTLLLFDTYEAAGEGQDWIEKDLLPSVISSPWLRVVIAGQRIPERNGAIWESYVCPIITLTPPTPTDWHEYAKSSHPELTLEAVEKVCKLAAGKASLLQQLLGPTA